MDSDRIGKIRPVSLEDEMRSSYIDYAMSVIVSRALPDVRDGLKPVHRRVLYAMWINGNRPGRPYVKCANIVGFVMGNFHPHGDTAMDPGRRTLQQVTVDDASSTDQIFSMLMGDKVEPRREFIEAHARDASLDV